MITNNKKIFILHKSEWFRNGILHRDDDLPAVMHINGLREWRLLGQLDRRTTGGPTVIHPDGTMEWYKYGEKHRESNMPAVIHPNGKCEWWYHGKLQRDNDLPAIITENGDKYYYMYGKCHRELNKPAVVYANGNVEWWIHGRKQKYPPRQKNNPWQNETCLICNNNIWLKMSVAVDGKNYDYCEECINTWHVGKNNDDYDEYSDYYRNYYAEDYDSEDYDSEDYDSDEDYDDEEVSKKYDIVPDSNKILYPIHYQRQWKLVDGIIVKVINNN